MKNGILGGKREAGSGKRKVVGRLVFALLLASCSSNGDQGVREAATADSASRFPLPASRETSRPTILFAGTSLTAGLGLEPEDSYPALVQQKLDSAGLRYQVVNAGISGETSAALLRRMDWLLRQPFEVVVIETGANDGLRGIPVEAMEGNIQQIIGAVRRARPAARIVLVQMEAPPNLGVTYTRRYRDVFPQVAKRNGALLMPFLLEGVAGIRALNQADGIHPNEAGSRIVAENVWKALRPAL